MARTLQTARKRLARSDSIDDDEVVANPDLDEQDAEKLKEIEEGSMRAEMKHIDKKFTEKGHQYYAETVEDIVPEQSNWWSKFALCIVRVFSNDVKNPYVRKVSKSMGTGVSLSQATRESQPYGRVSELRKVLLSSTESHGVGEIDLVCPHRCLHNC